MSEANGLGRIFLRRSMELHPKAITLVQSVLIDEGYICSREKAAGVIRTASETLGENWWAHGLPEMIAQQLAPLITVEGVGSQLGRGGLGRDHHANSHS